MRRMVVEVAGAVLVSIAAVLAVWGGVTALGLQERVMEDYMAQMGANAALGVVASTALLLFATSVGGLPLRAFSFSWAEGDGRFVLLGSSLTLLLAGAAVALASALGTHSVAYSGVYAGAWTVGLVGQAGVINEELTFRGYVLPRLRRRMGTGWALIVSAVLFALMHVPFRGAAPQMLATWVLGGLLFGFLYLKSGSLLPTLAVHVAHNLVLDMLAYSRPGVSLLSFEPDRLLPLQKAGLEMAWTLAIATLAWWIYGRGRPLLEPAPRLRRAWGSHGTGDT